MRAETMMAHVGQPSQCQPRCSIPHENYCYCRELRFANSKDRPQAWNPKQSWNLSWNRLGVKPLLMMEEKGFYSLPPSSTSSHSSLIVGGKNKAEKTNNCTKQRRHNRDIATRIPAHAFCALHRGKTRTSWTRPCMRSCVMGCARPLRVHSCALA